MNIFYTHTNAGTIYTTKLHILISHILPLIFYHDFFSYVYPLSITLFTHYPFLFFVAFKFQTSIDFLLNTSLSVPSHSLVFVFGFLEIRFIHYEINKYFCLFTKLKKCAHIFLCDEQPEGVNFTLLILGKRLLPVKKKILTSSLPRLKCHKVKRSRPSWSTWWNPVSTKNT